MSIILDALRRGRGRETPRPNANAAQTDAVLATLGYAKFSPTSPLNRLRRLTAYFVVGVMFAVLLWGVVVWLTQTLSTKPKADVAAVQPAATPAGRPAAANPSATPPNGTPTASPAAGP